MKLKSVGGKFLVDGNTHYYVLPIAFGLQHNGANVVCDTETRRACDGAIIVAEHITTVHSGTCTIVPTAGVTKNGRNVVMAEVMAEYITNHSGHYSSASNGDYTVVPSAADEFSTAGEIREILNFATSKTTTRRPHIVVVVKSWHAPRVRMLLRLISHFFKRSGYYTPQWDVVTVPSDVPYWHRLREIIALPHNALRIWRQYKNANAAL